MTKFALINIGLIIYSLGGVLKFFDHWREHGLTYIKHRSLLFLAVGPLVVAYAVYSDNLTTAVLIASNGVLAIIPMFLKSRDTYHTWRRKI